MAQSEKTNEDHHRQACLPDALGAQDLKGLSKEFEEKERHCGWNQSFKHLAVTRRCPCSADYKTQTGCNSSSLKKSANVCSSLPFPKIPKLHQKALGIVQNEKTGKNLPRTVEAKKVESNFVSHRAEKAHAAESQALEAGGA